MTPTQARAASIFAQEPPRDGRAFMHVQWAAIEPFFHDLLAVELAADNVSGWLSAWSWLSNVLDESYARLHVATTVNTEDKEAEAHHRRFLEAIYPPALAMEQKLKEKLLASGLEPEGFALPLRHMRAEADLFREANLPLITQEQNLVTELNKIYGAQTVEWEGKELTLIQLTPVYQETERARREKAWRLSMERWLADRGMINDVWTRFLALRKQMAANADKSDYRTYRWPLLHRFDYTPDDCRSFQDAIEQVVVPAAERIYTRRKELLGVERLRPWDLDVDPLGREPLRPFVEVADMEEKVGRIFNKMDPQLGGYFGVMRREGLLDLDNRKGKAPGGYCTNFDYAQQPFIFMNAVGLQRDVETLLHESGHSFHVFEMRGLPYQQQKSIALEFAEVASMSMELLSLPYLIGEDSFYTDVQAARARAEQLESIVLFWPYMAVVDAFQHWVYENDEAASDPAQCDAQWSKLWRRFMRGVDWDDFADAMATGWHRKHHIFKYPFYYVEYGLAQLGAVQVWRNALQNHASALAAYRRALALGATASLPELFAAAGANFAFDAATLQTAVDLLMQKIDEAWAQ